MQKGELMDDIRIDSNFSRKYQIGKHGATYYSRKRN
jgi:hypothetical protein